mmetsp:Transcript_3891/g.6478  ORF Transcript_3891/g.6478 Transcript_3891/m.6478 type:complete len:146 (-) Transcript_3891:2581-3018(-)
MSPQASGHVGALLHRLRAQRLVVQSPQRASVRKHARLARKRRRDLSLGGAQSDRVKKRLNLQRKRKRQLQSKMSLLAKLQSAVVFACYGLSKRSFFAGTIKEWNSSLNEYRVSYDDGDVEWIAFEREKIKWGDEEKASAKKRRRK